MWRCQPIDYVKVYTRLECINLKRNECRKWFCVCRLWSLFLWYFCCWSWDICRESGNVIPNGVSTASILNFRGWSFWTVLFQFAIIPWMTSRFLETDFESHSQFCKLDNSWFCGMNYIFSPVFEIPEELSDQIVPLCQNESWTFWANWKKVYFF